MFECESEDKTKDPENQKTAKQKTLRIAKIKAILDDVQSELMRACFKMFQTPHLIVSIFIFRCKSTSADVTAPLIKV